MEYRDELVHGLGYNGAASVIAVSGREAVEQMRRIHDCSPTVTAALGRLMMGAMVCASEIKNEKGDVSLIFNGGGPAGRAIAVAAPDGSMRATVVDPQADAPIRPDHKLNVAGVLGREGMLTVVRDEGRGEPYVGQVSLQSGEVAEDLAYYFATSEQRPCVVFLGVIVDREAEILGAGALAVFLLPNCPEEVIVDIEHRIGLFAEYTHILAEGQTIDDVLAILFQDANLEITARQPIAYRCNCSRERMERALTTIGREELLKLLEEDGQAELNCEFCRAKQLFTGEDLARLADLAGAVKRADIELTEQEDA